MRAQGFRLVQTWVPDVRAEGFASAAHAQALAVAAADRVSDDQDFVEVVSVDWNDAGSD